MTAADLYFSLAAQSTLVSIALLFLPGLIGWLAYALQLAGRQGPSQQVANGGIVIGLVSVVIEVLAIVYAVGVADANPITDAPAVFLAIPIYLAAAGFVVERLVHPGEQEEIRQRIRGFLIVGATLAVLTGIFSVLRIYMIVFSGMIGFVLFILALIALSYVMIRRVV